MGIEAVVFQQDPYINYGLKDLCTLLGSDHQTYTYNLEFGETSPCTYGSSNHKNELFSFETKLDPSFSSKMQNHSSISSATQKNVQVVNDGEDCLIETPVRRRKRRRTTSTKNKEEVENQRMTHIAVERNRRKQMNEYLGLLRALMPSSYAQRGDQASIIGGAINFIKELEQLLQSLEAQHKDKDLSTLFSDFFVFPQYSTSSKQQSETTVEKRSDVADVEVTMVESHANLKILTQKSPRQLLKMVIEFNSLGLSILHLNVTSVQHMVLYSFSVKVEDDCQLTCVNEIAAAVYEMVGSVLEEADFELRKSE